MLHAHKPIDGAAISAQRSRRPHLISRQLRTWTPRAILTVACQYDQRLVSTSPRRSVRTLARWCATYSRLERGTIVDQLHATGTDSDSWWTWLAARLSRRMTTWVVCEHAGHALPLLGAWDVLLSPGSEVSCAVLRDPPTVLRCRIGGKRLCLIDALNYYEASLGDGTDPQADCAALTRWILTALCHWHAHDLGRWATTGSGLAWSCYRHGYLDADIVVSAGGQETEDARSAYYAGRVCAWRHGHVQGPIAHLDINSLYPWAMISTRYPVRYLMSVEYPQRSDIMRRMADQCVIAWVGLRDTHATYPQRDQARTVYRPGDHQSWLAGPELARAIEAGDVRHIYRAHYYDAAAPFARYVADTYARKVDAERAGDMQSRALWKILLNGLAGKLAQRRQRWDDTSGVSGIAPYGEWWDTCDGQPEPRYMRSIAWHVQTRQRPGESDNSCPALAAYILSLSRERMRGLYAGQEGSAVHYHDTDSLHCTPQYRDTLASQGEVDRWRLGALREVETVPDAHYLGPRNYRIGQRVVAAGLQESAILGPDGLWRQDIAPSLESQVHAPTSGALEVREATYRRMDI